MIAAAAATSDPNSMLDWALVYAQAGFRVFPVHTIRNGACSCGGQSDCKPGKHPVGALVPRGLLNATTDPVVIDEWWSKMPDANIGLATGKESNLVVIDVDGTQGERTLTELERRYGPLPATVEVKTDKGRHLHYAYPKGVAKVKSVAKKKLGLDVRGDGGYVVAPPSIHESGHKYDFKANSPPELAGCPAWVVAYANGDLKLDGLSTGALSEETTVTLLGEPKLAVVLAQAAAPCPHCETEEARLRSALSFIPSDERKTWCDVGAAIHWLNWGEKGFLIWDDWSRTCSDLQLYNEADQQKTWKSFDRPYNGVRITVATIFHTAKERGWTGQTRKDATINDATSPRTERFRELAALAPVDYDLIRAKEAEKIGIRVSTLDDEVRKFRDEPDDSSRAGRTLVLPTPEPWPDPVDGAMLINEVSRIIVRFVFLPKEAAVAVALWIIHAHAFESSLITPRLVITSPEKRCGKTTLLRVIQALVPKALSAANITPAAIFRTVELVRPTLLIDEADTFLRENEELRGILNSGHSKGGQVVRLVGEDHEPRTFSTYCPTAIAAIGWLPGTIEDRSIKIVMRRRRSDEPVERFREDRIEALSTLAQKARRWSDDHMEALTKADPDAPGHLNDRAIDNWRPLFAIADLAGRHWPELSRKVASVLSEGSASDHESRRTMLLSDIRSAFQARNTDRLSSDQIVTFLVSIDERPWSEQNKGHPITKASLARLLNPFGISSATIRLDGNHTAKGYYLSRFEDAFRRYLAPETVTTSQG